MLFYTNSTSTIEYFTYEITFQEIAQECQIEGGVPVFKQDSTFNLISDTSAIPVGQEFWVGDILYTDWIYPLDCVRKSSIYDNSQTPKITNKISDCYQHCFEYQVFCNSESYQKISVQIQSECTDECDDIGLCGGGGSNSQSYVSVYNTASDVTNHNIHVVYDTSIGTSSYVECLTARCQLNEYRAMNCNSEPTKVALCDTGDVTDIGTYNNGLLSCSQKVGSYLSVYQCHNSTFRIAWIGPFRFTFTPYDGMIPGLRIARGAKCVKTNMGNVNCIQTTEQTDLPFICAIGTNQQQSTTPDPPRNTKTHNDGDSMTGIIVGCVLGVTFVFVTVIVVIIWRKKQKARKDRLDIDNLEVINTTPNEYEIPRRDSRVYDHIYAQSTDVYHPYLEIRDGSVSGYNGQNGQFTSMQESNFQPVNLPNDIKETVNTNDITISTVNLGTNGYIEPARTPNFGRKLPDIPLDQR
ncbi:unnamed protein product [Mytilus coruscus]|uniref:Uncharacterized protein n=1 Tax=Mytilus coruscus TaxID=42192 RepID=A0A6J8D408_MYTCO|nr:unnamed protein product [Mytilus coruscus]